MYTCDIDLTKSLRQNVIKTYGVQLFAIYKTSAEAKAL